MPIRGVTWPVRRGCVILCMCKGALEGGIRRKIRLIEGNAKRRHLKKFTCKGTLRQVFICLRPPPLLWPHILPYTLCICVYCKLIHTGKAGGGRDEPERRLEEQQFTPWVENTNMADCISSLLTLINTCRKVPLQVRWRHFALVSI
jgi:hypothetical protein